MGVTTARTELRRDPTSGRWVLVRNRAPRSTRDDPCRFCPGHEAQTPPEIAAYRTNGQLANSSDWLVRVIPDFAPLLQIEGDVFREAVGIFDKVSARGASEIVIETPDHDASWDTLPSEDVERVLRMYRERIEDLYRDGQIRAVLIVRREGTPGAHISHPFSRILGAPVLFDDLQRELVTSAQYFAYKQRCLYCDILQQESRDGIRVIEQTQRFLVYTPYGSRRPFETWVVPQTHRHRFERISPPEMPELARSLQGAFRRLHAVQPGAPLEITLHTAPNEAVRLEDTEWRTLPEDYHWHIEIVPGGSDGEIVGGFAVNAIPPEEAARQLRDAF
jgi:UDPglucose--hexose-1-phosphate uridylyltransferase